MKTANHSAFELYYHVVFATKYRHQCITAELGERLRVVLTELVVKWRSSLMDFAFESDHVHLLIEAHPAMDLSVMMNNLKTVSSRRIRKEFAEHLQAYYWKPYFWSRGYAVKTACKGATIDTLIEYFKNQETPQP